MAPLRVLVVDDHRSFASALALVIDGQPDLQVVGVVHDAPTVVPATLDAAPDVVVLDVELGDESGLDVLRDLAELPAGPAVVMLSGHGRPEVACAAFRRGAAAFVSKDEPTDALAGAIRAAVNGGGYLAPPLLGAVLRLLAQPGEPVSRERGLLATLSPREVEILACLEEGLDRAAIAARLYLSVHTVRTHVRNILAKLEVHSSLEAVAVARRARAGHGPVPAGGGAPSLHLL